MPKLTRIKLERVYYIPPALEPGVLYVSEEFDAAVHLCACGCGTKVSTPLGPSEWSVHDTPEGPTLRPSVGNWQMPCRSHYLITRGEVRWGGAWTAEQIERGRRAEGQRREEYYEARARERKPKNLFVRLWERLKRLFE